MRKYIKNEKIDKTIEYPPYKCKCCGIGDIVEEYDICHYCGWEDDGIQNYNPDYMGGANHMSLNQYKKFWQENKNEILKNLEIKPLYAIEKSKEYYKNYSKKN